MFSADQSRLIDPLASVLHLAAPPGRFCLTQALPLCAPPLACPSAFAYLTRKPPNLNHSYVRLDAATPRQLEIPGENGVSPKFGDERYIVPCKNPVFSAAFLAYVRRNPRFVKYVPTPLRSTATLLCQRNAHSKAR
jgi:hypothetical protein